MFCATPENPPRFSNSLLMAMMHGSTAPPVLICPWAASCAVCEALSPEYHTSADNLEFIVPRQLSGSLRTCAAILDVLERNQRYCNLNPYGEPQLGRRGLYRR